MSAMPTIIRVSNPNNLPLIDYRTVKPLQGGLKDLSERNYNKLKRVLIKRGFKVPLFIWKHRPAVKATIESDGTHIQEPLPPYEYYLMDGHQRQRVMIKEDMQPYELPYILIEADTLQQAKAELLEISSQYGTITQEGFDTFSADLPEADIMDFSFDALPQFSREDVEPEQDEPPEVNESSEPVSKRGEVYQLGSHKLMCGDATLLGHVSELVNDAPVSLFLTDPPYNVDYTGGTKDALKIENDAKSDQEFKQLLVDAFTNAQMVMREGAAFYIFHSDSEGYNFRTAVREAELHLRQVLVWAKDSMVLGRQDYQWQHEPILYGWKDGASHSWYSDRSQTTLLHFDRPRRSEEHPTMKPLNILDYLIRNSTKEGDIVLDLFGGSGSTLIACEQNGRTCLMMELDPRYCDVIRKRYAQLLDRGDEWQSITPIVNIEESSNAEPTELNSAA